MSRAGWAVGGAIHEAKRPAPLVAPNASDSPDRASFLPRIRLIRRVRGARSVARASESFQPGAIISPLRIRGERADYAKPICARKATSWQTRLAQARAKPIGLGQPAVVAAGAGDSPPAGGACRDNVCRQ